MKQEAPEAETDIRVNPALGPSTSSVLSFHYCLSSHLRLRVDVDFSLKKRAERKAKEERRALRKKAAARREQAAQRMRR